MVACLFVPVIRGISCAEWLNQTILSHDDTSLSTFIFRDAMNNKPGVSVPVGSGLVSASRSQIGTHALFFAPFCSLLIGVSCCDTWVKTTPLFPHATQAWEEEYNAITDGNGSKAALSNDPANSGLNRYRNIVAYDKTRVVVEKSAVSMPKQDPFNTSAIRHSTMSRPCDRFNERRGRSGPWFSPPPFPLFRARFSLSSSTTTTST